MTNPVALAVWMGLAIVAAFAAAALVKLLCLALEGPGRE